MHISSEATLTELAMKYRLANATDADALAVMNHALIRDEGHRNRMTIDQLAQRMRGFFPAGYQGLIFEANDPPVGYALFKPEHDWVYLRQFYVRPEFRRRGIGRAAIA